MRRRRKAPDHRLGRALTGLLLGLGVAAVALSFVPAPAPRAPTAILPVEDTPDLAQPASPARAAPASQQTAPPATRPSAAVIEPARTDQATQSISETNPVTVSSPEAVVPPPASRQPAPRDARPATDARSLSDGRLAVQRVSTPQAPFSVVVTLQDPTLGPLGQDVVNGLNRAGVLARIASLEEAGRPDVILAISAVEGERNEAWYCDPGPEQSTVLALSLLDSLDGGSTEGATAAAEPQSDFPCEDIHSGRARVPAVLLELVDGAVAVSAAPIVSTLDRYFDQQRGEVLAARATPRLVWPATGPVTSHYGLDHPLGIDIGQSEGPIVAATDGVVVFAGGNPCCSYGHYVVVAGVDGTGTLYAHLNSLGVSEGQRVRQGDVLGQVGCTGTCFGTHLHFEVFEAGARLDPMRYLP